MYEEETEQHGNWNYHHNPREGRNDGGKQLLLLTSWLTKGLPLAMPPGQRPSPLGNATSLARYLHYNLSNPDFLSLIPGNTWVLNYFLFCELLIFQEPGESAAVEKTNNLFDAESPMFRKAIYTCIGLVAVLTICGLIWEFAYWRPRQPKEAKTGEWLA